MGVWVICVIFLLFFLNREKHRNLTPSAPVSEADDQNMEIAHEKELQILNPGDQVI